ncbi:cell wall-binding repeat-containing protein [Microbacterium sp.]|uniref:cell wall-binding repeat-containing protein n=1 Tax=Microbacterium sp. TaxID=51671 RepID=UPI003A8DC3CF
MSQSVPRTRSARGVSRFLTVFVAVVAVVVGTVAPSTVAPASAAVGASTSLSRVAGGVQSGIVKTTLTGFKPGNIISDAVFTNKNAMSEGQIQSFFNSKVSECVIGKDENGKPFVCLKDFRITSVNRSADSYCSGYNGAANESAARIIYKVAQACNINPQVLIVMLQKEQGLVTHVWPSAWRYDSALGQGCPDTAPCDPNFVGFFHQIYGAARQMQIYMEGRWFQWYKAGKTWQIQYHPDRTRCGTSPVYIENKATEALYYYTPYQPNAAAMRAGSGTGDSCSSYGNRNFYNYFTDWFGSTTYRQFSPAGVTVQGTFTPGQVVRVSGSFAPTPTTTLYQWYRNGEVIPGATRSSYSVIVADVGAKIDVIVFARTSGYQEGQQRSPAYTVSPVSVDRVHGSTREETAISVSQTSWPTGTKTVFLATSLEFADALSAAAATGNADAALLLTPADGLPQSVSNELARLKPDKVVLMGGEGVLTPKVVDGVKVAVPGAGITRLSGADRFETSRNIVESSGESKNLLIASGWGFPDALSAASVGSNTGTPVLLVDGTASALDAASVATIRKVGATSVTIVGGTGVVNGRIETSLKSNGIKVNRLAGSDRYLTNAAVNNAYFSNTTPRVLIAAGTDFPDALAGSALAGRWKVPLLLSEQTCLPMPNSDFIRTHVTNSVVLVGGHGVLSEEGMGQLRACG